MPKKFTANGFSTVLPDGWTDSSVISLVNTNTTTGFATNVVVLRQTVAPGTNIEQYAREQTREINQSVEKFQLLDQRTTIIQGNPAYELLQRFVANNRSLQQAQTFVLHKDTVFAVTCSALVEEFNDSIRAFREVVENLRFD